MKRIVSVWLPHLPIERMAVAEPGSIPAEPFVLVAGEARGQVISAVNAAARRSGIAPGLALADARALLPALASRAAEPQRDRSALTRLAYWAGRYGPTRNRDGVDALWIDITGVAHLFAKPTGWVERASAAGAIDNIDGRARNPACDGVSDRPSDTCEAALLADLGRRLAGFGLTARIGLADTLGAAHALARFACDARNPFAIAAAGTTSATLAPLPVEALRLEPAAVLLLKRLGLTRIRDLYALPRAALERRFRDKGAAAGVLQRLDQALGRAAEPRRPLAETPVLALRRSYAEPLILTETIEAETQALAADLAQRLAALGQGVRRITLTLYRTDASFAAIGAGTSRPSRAPRHLYALLADRLAGIDAGFGIDALVLEAVRTERLDAAQTTIATAADAPDPAILIDRLVSRLGGTCVFALQPQASHQPERAAIRVPALLAADRQAPAAPPPRGATAPRPPFLMARPEPIAVMAEVPEGAPLRFTWRRRPRRIVRAEGPERIMPEWWRAIGATGPPPAVRDYYRLEDEDGGRYWVFRAGLYCDLDDSEEAGTAPAWYLHGLFP